MWARSALVVVLLGCPVAAQGSRVVVHLDGDPRERILVEGRGSFVHDARHVREGLGALRVRPVKERRYFGVTLFNLAGRSPRTLRLGVFQEGDASVRYLLKVEDDRGYPKRQEAGYLELTADPGWSDVVVDLTAVPTRRNTRTLDFTRGIRRLRFSRRNDRAAGPGFILDDVRFVGEPDAADLLEDLKRDLALEDGHERTRGLRAKLPLLPEPDRVKLALRILARDEHESVRRVCREALAGAGGNDSVDAVLQALRKARGERRVELCRVLATLSSARARREALALAKAPRTGTEERTALVAGLGRRGATDLAPLLAACGPRGPWPPRAALVEALFISACNDAVDLLIEVLQDPGSPRVEWDAAQALSALTGRSLGSNARAWRAWWRVNRDRTVLTPDGRPGAGRYATFYGIPVVKGRVAFVLDLSGSMREPVKGGRAREHIRKSEHLAGRDIRTRLDLAKAELIHALEGLPEGSAVGVVLYSDGVTWATKGVQKLDARLRKRLLRRVNGLGARGYTNIHDGMHAAFHPDRKGHQPARRGPDTIFLLTDGNPSRGPITRRSELRDAILRWNLGRMIRIHTINVGARDSSWLRTLARRSRGVFVDLTSGDGSRQGPGSNR